MNHQLANLSFFQVAVVLLLAANLLVLILVLLKRARVQEVTVPSTNVLTNTGQNKMNNAISMAAAFLSKCIRSGNYALATRNSEGIIQFHHGTGHVFVAFFISEAMLGLLDETERALILVRILSEENGGAWGYSRSYDLVDADDSAFVIRALRLLSAGRAPDCLMRFYREAEKIFAWIDVPGPMALTLEHSMDNNFQAQPEVNANVFLALRGTAFENLINYDVLLQWQHEEGYFQSYFYPSKIHASLMAIDLFRGKLELLPATQRALAYIAKSQNANGSWGADGDPYETALAVQALAAQEGYEDVMRRGVEYLLGTMAADGSWSSKARIWQWLGAEGWWYGLDEDRALVTACCLTALRRAAGHFVGSPVEPLWKWTPEYAAFAKAAGQS